MSITCSACAGGLLVAGFVRSSRRDTPPTTMFFKRKYGGPIKKDGRGSPDMSRLSVAARVTCMCSIHWMSNATTLRRTSMQSMVHNIMVSRLLRFVGGGGDFLCFNDGTGNFDLSIYDLRVVFPFMLDREVLAMQFW